MIVNHTNHPSQSWSKKQLKAARIYGSVEDIPFPHIDPAIETADVIELVRNYANMIISKNPSAVLCQGEYVYCHAMVHELLSRGIKVLAATSQRRVEEVYDNGIIQKEVIFEFVRFREYATV